ncbi:Virulence factor Mce family protein [uncultured Mycobacterium sp.]|uniref:Virulence factor Mce family protein n=1 Tax=uncultured Mycobacterium sp. TaxID=171292 RepID=A0A1Y5PKB5_9MYCO|nr:Virulence factor Mce family protein [uncultured Mycobacterium sp.]
MREEMKVLAERNRFALGAVAIVATAAAVLGVLNYEKLPFFSAGRDYSAHFAQAGGLASGAAVQISGMRVGQVSSVSLDGPHVLVRFSVDKGVRLGDGTEAAIKTKTVLGSKILEVMPRGDGQLSAPIPEDRTHSPYQLSDALGDLTATISGLNTDQLSDSLATLAETFSDTPPELRVAVQGVARFSEILNQRDSQLRDLLANAKKAASVLSERSDQIVRLISDTNALLVSLRRESAALDQISSNISAVSQQLKGFIAENRQTFRPALEKLNGVLTVVDKHKEDLQKSVKLLNQYAMSLGESVGSGPFFKAYLANLLPGQFLQPFIDAAFSDLGLDPNTLLPSQLSDPEVGQRATPPLPLPFPRTGQAGDPRLTIPDAITGKPGDQGCGPPGLPLPGPTGCYPYRDPGPAPAPGGPPPGPPAIVLPPPPPAAPVYETAPGEPAQGGQR